MKQISPLCLISACLIAVVRSQIIFSPAEVTLAVNQSVDVSLKISVKHNSTVNLQLGTVDDKIDCVTINPKQLDILIGQNFSNFEIDTRKVASEIFVEIIECHIDENNCTFSLVSANTRLRIVHSLALETIIYIVGWIYFCAWSISFYPQIYLNWKRKSVVGLNFDFLALNLAGFLCYSVFNCALRYNPTVQAEYLELHGYRARIPVRLNDVAFGVHALLATMLTIGQASLYQRANQRVSYTCWSFLAAFTSFFLVTLILTAAQVFPWLNWLRFVTFVSYIKILITLIKYMPQAYFNYRRKSTVGWSIGNIILDFTGGSFSILQMFLDSYNVDDYTEYFGDITKFALGLISILFDVLFMVQHYILYRGNREYKIMPEPIDSEAQIIESEREERDTRD